MAKLSHGNRPAVYIMRLLYKERYKVLFSGSVFKLNFHYISLLGNAKKKKNTENKPREKYKKFIILYVYILAHMRLKSYYYSGVY